MAGFIFIVLLHLFMFKISNQATLQNKSKVYIENYLHSYCSYSMKYRLISIKNLQADFTSDSTRNTSSTFLTAYLNKINCNSIHFLSNSLNDISIQLESQKFGVLQIIFDFSTAQMDKTKFNLILIKQSKLYTNCLNCKPFLNLFSLPEDRLNSWSKDILPTVATNFQAVLINNDNYASIHIRPVLDGCYLYPSIYWPHTELGFQRLETKAKNCNLNGIRLKMTVNKGFPVCEFIKNAQNEIEIQYSIEFELLSLMKAKYNFTSQFFDAKNAWGIRLESGEWTGLIGQVQNEITDVGICNIARTLERLAVVDFSEYTILDQIIILSRSPTLKKNDLIFSNRISRSVWLYNFASFVVISSLLAFIARLYSKSCFFKQKHRRNRWKTYGTIAVRLYGICLKQSMISISKETIVPMRILYAVWIMAALVLANGYSSAFYSMLTVPEYDRPIDTVDDLIRVATTDTHRIIVKDQSSFEMSIMNARPEDGLYYLVKEHLERTKQKLLNDSTLAIPALEEDKGLVLLTVKMMTQTRLQMFARKPLHVSSEALEAIYIGWVFRKRSPLLAPFNLIIVRIREGGLYDKWMQNTVRKKSLQLHQRVVSIKRERFIGMRKGYGNRKVSTLNLDDLYSVFMTWIIGLAMCTAIMAMEYLIHCWCTTKVKQFSY